MLLRQSYIIWLNRKLVALGILFVQKNRPVLSTTLPPMFKLQSQSILKFFLTICFNQALTKVTDNYIFQRTNLFFLQRYLLESLGGK